jgi:hypothetical protein
MGLVLPFLQTQILMGHILLKINMIILAMGSDAKRGNDSGE